MSVGTKPTRPEDLEPFDLLIEPQPVIQGAGYWTKRYLSKIGIKPTAVCSCNRIAAEMDRRGPDWCEANLESILDQMQREAMQRKLWKRLFNRRVAEAIVRRAIKKAATN